MMLTIKLSSHVYVFRFSHIYRDEGEIFTVFFYRIKLREKWRLLTKEMERSEVIVTIFPAKKRFQFYVRTLGHSYNSPTFFSFELRTIYLALESLSHRFCFDLVEIRIFRSSTSKYWIKFNCTHILENITLYECCWAVLVQLMQIIG